MTGYDRKFVRWIGILVIAVILTEANSGGEADMQRASPPAQEGMIKLSDSNIQYFSQGQGKPIVLLPFGGLKVGYMAGLSQNLADAGYRVIRINFRGSGVPDQEKASHYIRWLKTSLA